MQADAWRCLASEENKLSVYRLCDPDKQLDWVVAALALTRDSVANVDLALVPEDVLEAYQIQVCETPGGSPDSTVNGWHMDLVELSLNKVFPFLLIPDIHPAMRRR